MVLRTHLAFWISVCTLVRRILWFSNQNSIKMTLTQADSVLIFPTRAFLLHVWRSVHDKRTPKQIMCALSTQQRRARERKERCAAGGWALWGYYFICWRNVDRPGANKRARKTSSVHPSVQKAALAGEISANTQELRSRPPWQPRAAL